jgi:AcrR family transcriptional regulator
MKSKLNPKVEQIEKAGKDLFWKYGIKRVTVEEICIEANVSKMTFYKYFENKLSLVKFIIDNITSGAIVEYKSIMNQNIPFKEKVKKTLDMKMKGSEQMSEEFYNDYMRNTNPEMVEFLQKQISKSFGLIMKDYIEAQKDGEIRKDIKPEFILYYLNHMVEMMKDPNLEKMYSKPQDLIMEMTNFFFYGVLPRNK